MATTDQRNGYRFNQGPHALYLGGEAMGVLREPGSVARRHAAHPWPAHGPRRKPPPAPGGVGSLLRTKVIGVREKVELASLMARLPRLASADHAGRTVNEWLADLTDRERVRALLHAIVRLAT